MSGKDRLDPSRGPRPTGGAQSGEAHATFEIRDEDLRFHYAPQIMNRALSRVEQSRSAGSRGLELRAALREVLREEENRTAAECRAVIGYTLKSEPRPFDDAGGAADV